MLRPLHLPTALAALLAALLAGCGTSEATAPVVLEAPRVLVLHSPQDPGGAVVLAQTTRTLDYARTPYDTLDVARGLPPLDAYAAVAVTTERLFTLPDSAARRLDAYVRAGGGLAVLYRGQHPALHDLLGFAPGFLGAFREPVPERLTFVAPLLAGLEGLTVGPTALSSLDVRPADDAHIIARAGPDGRAVAWRTMHGAGRVVFWNTSTLSDRAYRGFIIQSISAVMPHAVRPLANWAMMHLDDFPNSASNDLIEPVASEFGMTSAVFYADRWWPDMKDLADRFDIPYSATVIFNYNGRTEPPFQFYEWLNGTIEVGLRPTPYSPWIARQVLRRDDEMALHGYNHQSLTLDIWRDASHMRLALEAAARRWRQDRLGPLPTTYVPPMNVIDSVGVRALAEGMPSLDLISGLYIGPFELGQGREFGPEPWAPERFYHLPRTTAGFIPTDYQRLLQISVLNLVGGWGHFVHPDDVYPNEHRTASLEEAGIEVPPEGFQWRNDPHADGLFYQFEDWLEYTERHYPWLRYRTTRDAFAEHLRYDALELGWTASDDVVTLQLSAVPATFIYHSAAGARVREVRGGRVLHSGASALFTYYVVEATRPSVTLTLDAPA